VQEITLPERSARENLLLNSPADLTAVLQEQQAYYQARASEYDQWWLRQGRYDRGPELKAQWLAEAAAVKAALHDFRPAGRVLELACGTGIWTEQLSRYPDGLTAIDASAEMLRINAARVGSPGVRYVEADLFRWRPEADERYDTVFFGFWLSHVPPQCFAQFWELVQSCLAPGGRVFFVDSRHQETSTAVDHILPEPSATVLQRRLNDGREFRIYKIFYDPAALRGELQELGWNFDIRQTGHYFIYGSGQRAPAGRLG
jgi:SAM-dependent methyltransferase